MVALAFLIPLILVVQQLARERALADAERQTAAVVAVLAITSDRGAVERAIAATDGADGGGSRVAVHGLGGPRIGNGHARAEDVRLAAGQKQPVVAEVPGGLAYIEPVDLGAGRTAVIEVYVPAAELTRGVRSAWNALIAVAVCLVLVSVLVGDRLAAKVVGSARGLARAASALGNGDLGVRVKPTGPRELVDASMAFNVMADRVLRLLATERELVADLSHRLRTPLTVLRLESETLPDGEGAERIRHAIGALEGEIDDLIRTARRPVDLIGPAEPNRCDAAEVVRERLTFWAAVAEDQRRPCTVRVPSRPTPVPVPGADLAAALDALLGNVFRHTAQGTALEVAVAHRDGYVVLRVEDAGPGIDDPDRALRRGASDHGSTGLGLDIARRVAIAAGGTVSIDRGKLGGARVLLLLTDADLQGGTHLLAGHARPAESTRWWHLRGRS